MKYTIFALIILLSASIAAQEANSFKQREIGLSIGVRTWHIQEQRFSNRIKKSSLINMGLFHKRTTNASRFYLASNFSINMKPTRGSGVRYALFSPEVRLSYQRKANNFWIGPSLTNLTLVNLPQNTHGMFNNNPVSYTGVTSVGLSIDRTVDIRESGVTLDGGLDYALLSHVIRPAYAHPYPEDFLREEVFDPTRAGIAKAVARSGKLKSLKGFQSLKIRLGVSYMLGDSFKVGLVYEGQLLKVNEDKSLSATAQDIFFTISHTY